MNHSQKKVLDYYKQTSGKFYVYSFDVHTGRRYSAYGGLDCLTAFQEMVNKSQAGYLVLALDEDGDKKATKWEIEKGGRVPYFICKEFAVKTYILSNAVYNGEEK